MEKKNVTHYIRKNTAERKSNLKSKPTPYPSTSYALLHGATTNACRCYKRVVKVLLKLAETTTPLISTSF
jgi:hypothetical protein